MCSSAFNDNCHETTARQGSSQSHENVLVRVDLPIRMIFTVTEMHRAKFKAEGHGTAIGSLPHSIERNANQKLSVTHRMLAQRALC